MALPTWKSAHTATPLSAHSFHSLMWCWRNVISLVLACRFCAVISFKHDKFTPCQFVCWVCGMIAQEWLTNPKWNSLIGVKINLCKLRLVYIYVRDYSYTESKKKLAIIIVFVVVICNQLQSFKSHTLSQNSWFKCIHVWFEMIVTGAWKWFYFHFPE